MDSVILQDDSHEAYLKPYLFDEGSTTFLFAFLFKGLPGVGAAFLRVASRAVWHADRLPFRAQDSAVGKAEGGNYFEG